jgi:hypothetical protein
MKARIDASSRLAKATRGYSNPIMQIFRFAPPMPAIIQDSMTAAFAKERSE